MSSFVTTPRKVRVTAPTKLPAGPAGLLYWSTVKVTQSLTNNVPRQRPVAPTFHSAIGEDATRSTSHHGSISAEQSGRFTRALQAYQSTHPDVPPAVVRTIVLRRLARRSAVPTAR